MPKLLMQMKSTRVLSMKNEDRVAYLTSSEGFP